MKKIHVILAALALVAVAAVGYSATQSPAHGAKAQDCCTGGACCDGGACCR